MGMVLSRNTMLEPYYEIYLANEKLSSSLKKYIVSVEVEESDTEADVGRISVADIDFKFSNMTKLSENMPVKIYMGHKKNHRLMLKGVISYIEADFGEDGVPYIVIGATDNTSRMTFKTKSRTWKNKKSSEVVKSIAKAYGFKAEVQESLNVIEQITQEEETDAQLISRLAEDEGYIFFYSSDKGTLYWGERFKGLTATDNLYYNSGDHSVITFKPTLVQKNKAELVEEEESSVSDDSGKKVSTKNNGNGGNGNSGSGKSAPPSSSKSGGDTKIPISTLTGEVGSSQYSYPINKGSSNYKAPSSYEEPPADLWEKPIVAKSPTDRYYGGSKTKSSSNNSGGGGPLSLSSIRKY